MTFQELFAGHNIDWKRVKLVRHNLTNEAVEANYSRNYLELYQSVQTPARFKNCDMIISFLGETGTNGVFQGCYKVSGTKPYHRTDFPDDFTPDGGMVEDDSVVVYELTQTDLLADLKGRLVIDWGKGTINWCQNGTTEKELLEIRPVSSRLPFPGYDEVILSFETLCEIVYNSSAYREWEEKLSSVAGVYLITDTKTGKHYVGSASGEDGGIWNRWSEYARTKHGGNKRLKELITADADYCNNFQYSILEVLPLKREKKEVLDCEARYKQKLLSIKFGLNDN